MSTTYPIKDSRALADFKNYYVSAKINFRNYALIVMGLNTAARIGDLLQLQWKDVYNKEEKKFREHIFMKEQKTGKERAVAINTTVQETLNLLCKNSLSSGNEDYLFPSNKNKKRPLSRYQAYRIIKEAAQNTGLQEHISCHSLRKTFGYHAWKQGVSPAVLMDIYNHSSYKITRRYLCIEQDDRDKVYMNIKL